MVKSILGLLLLLPAAAPEGITVQGTVTFDGTPPPVKPNKQISKDPKCAALHPGDPPREDLVVDAGGGVKWAFVYVKKGLEGKSFQAPAGAVLIDQVGCLYSPHVAGVMIGQPLNFRNSDPLLHNVHPVPFSNKEVNCAQTQGAVDAVKFTTPEVMIQVGCNVHPWMRCWVGALDHPFFAVTDEKGKFEIKNLPPGKYTLGVWHETLELKDVEITVKENTTVDVKLKPKAP